MSDNHDAAIAYGVDHGRLLDDDEELEHETEASLIWDRIEFDKAGNKVDIYKTTEWRSDSCKYCDDGNCEQEVHRSVAYSCDVVVHDRPSTVN